MGLLGCLGCLGPGKGSAEFPDGEAWRPAKPPVSAPNPEPEHVSPKQLVEQPKVVEQRIVDEVPVYDTRALRGDLALVTSPGWAERLGRGAQRLREHADAALASVFGLTRGSDGQFLLVSLASAGAAAPALPVGELLPFCQTLNPADPTGSKPIALPPWEVPPVLSGAKVQNGGLAERIAASEAWQRVLQGLKAYCPPDHAAEPCSAAPLAEQDTSAAGGTRWHAMLVPMQLGYRVVGAVLLLLPASSPVAAPVAAAAAVDSLGADGAVAIAVAAGAGAAADAAAGLETGGGQDVTAGANAGALLQPLLRTPGAPEAIAACVAECCLGPVLPQVEQACTYTELVSSSPSLQELSSALTGAISTSLSYDLHVDVTVRLALLPHKDASHGVLFEEAAATRRGGALAGHAGGHFGASGGGAGAIRVLPNSGAATMPNNQPMRSTSGLPYIFAATQPAAVGTGAGGGGGGGSMAAAANAAPMPYLSVGGQTATGSRGAGGVGSPACTGIARSAQPVAQTGTVHASTEDLLGLPVFSPSGASGTDTGTGGGAYVTAGGGTACTTGTGPTAGGTGVTCGTGGTGGTNGTNGTGGTGGTGSGSWWSVRRRVGNRPQVKASTFPLGSTLAAALFATHPPAPGAATPVCAAGLATAFGSSAGGGGSGAVGAVAAAALSGSLASASLASTAITASTATTNATGTTTLTNLTAATSHSAAGVTAGSPGGHQPALAATLPTVAAPGTANTPSSGITAQCRRSIPGGVATRGFVSTTANGAGGACGSGLRLAGALISNVASYLQDPEHPTDDAFLIFRSGGRGTSTAASGGFASGAGIGPGPSALIAVAGWYGGTSAGAARTPTAVGMGHAAACMSAPANAVSSAPNLPSAAVAAAAATARRQRPASQFPLAQAQAVSPHQMMASLGIGVTSPASCGYATSGAAPASGAHHTGVHAGTGTGAASHGGVHTHSLNLHGAGAVDAAALGTSPAAFGGAGVGSPPAYVLYLTSAIPLPVALLTAARDRVMCLLEVLLPAATRSLLGPVLDEWAYLCMQTGLGGAGGSVAPSIAPASGCHFATLPLGALNININSGAHGGPGGGQGAGSGLLGDDATAVGGGGSSMSVGTGGGGGGGSLGLGGGLCGTGSGSPHVRVLVRGEGARSRHQFGSDSVVGGRSLNTHGGAPESIQAVGRHLPSHGDGYGGGASSAASGTMTLAYDCSHRPSPSAAATASPGAASHGSGNGSSVTLRVPGMRGNVTINGPGAGVLSSPRPEAALASGGGGGGSGFSHPAPPATSGDFAAAANAGRAARTGKRRLLQAGPGQQHDSNGAALHSASTCHEDGMGTQGNGTTSNTAATMRDGSGAVGHAAGGGGGTSSMYGSGGAPVAISTVGSAAAAGSGGGFLSTLLSDGRDTAKEARQAQLDIMVSAFHSALAKARYEANLMAGAHAEDDIRALRLLKTIGTGGCSVVVLGRLHAMPVAVKVILPAADDEEDALQNNGSGEGSPMNGGVAEGEPYTPAVAMLAQPRTPVPGLLPRPCTAARQTRLRLMMRGARELAVMGSISHPNIVQVYSYCTRVTVHQSPTGLPQLEVVPEGAPVTSPLCTALIMEYCDMGSLADAIDCGTFARAARNAAAALHDAVKARGAQSAATGRADRGQLSPPVSGAAGGAPLPAAQATAPMSGSLPASGPGAAPAAGAIEPAPGQLQPQGPAPVSNGSTASGGGNRPRFTVGVVSPAVAATAGTPAMRAVYLTLLEVALALRHLHSMNLVHCDVKPANVLLRSSATDPRGFTAKLTDFGFVNFLEADSGYRCMEAGEEEAPSGGAAAAESALGSRATLRFNEPVGTVTHMSPELFIKGSVVDSSIDVYAFGILMWELATGRAPYPEYADSHFVDVPYKVVKEGLRPRFPADTPLHFKLVAQECWSAQPSRRPTAAALVNRLQRLLDLSCGLAQPGPNGV
ncbi:hypothetical protein HYH02_000850 [Chlamydomonas schloesseri]|uniref:Protein kinase domain-containing protein n=1 Tax=Chlamydomonas schloesseri TaxID=2026947 RepID=A0A835WZC5_9CHLO|nr:hypothetical protein HYH02_000850 [Chlamydomonas schloesseri]|eukprot:KAG2455025.1 hypothetical protein HYH02_000850 [Chlamydomonas schloesseri]